MPTCHSPYRSHRTPYTSVLIALVWLFHGTGCASESRPPARVSKTATKEVFRIGIAETAPPVIFEKGGHPAGIEVDLARKLASALGKEIEFVSMFWPNLIIELRTQHIDIVMSGMSITPRREKLVAFANPYLVIGQQAMIRARDRSRLGTKDSIISNAIRAGVETGSTGEEYVLHNLPNATRVSLPTLEKAAEALIDGKIDAVVYDSPSIQWLVAQRKGDGLMAVPGLLTRESLAWAVHRENTELLTAINHLLQQWKRDGTLERIISRWIPYPH